jgi:uncharacterized protein YjbJ (UPF0337 family)
MNNDKLNGMADKAKGAIKEGVGKALGDTKLETEGKIDTVKGKAETVVGEVKDTIRDLRDPK